MFWPPPYQLLGDRFEQKGGNLSPQAVFGAATYKTLRASVKRPSLVSSVRRGEALLTALCVGSNVAQSGLLPTTRVISAAPLFPMGWPECSTHLDIDPSYPCSLPVLNQFVLCVRSVC